MGELAKIRIVEDDATIRALLEMALLGAGYSDVASSARGDEGLEMIRREKPDLVLLDVMLPGLDGFSIARRVRESSELAATRIVMLTARTAPEDIVRGLDSGADDYVTKPFDRKVLLARVKAVLRRGLPVTEGVDFDGLRIDEPSRVANRGRVFVRPPDERTVDVQVAKLRQKLGKWADHIETVRGVGYRIGI